MNSLKIRCKICGLSRMEDIIAANKLKPDYIGFVFAVKSRRFVSPETCKSLYKALDRQIKSVAVFVNEPLVSMEKLVKEPLFDCIQLHGQEDETYIRSLRTITDKPVFQAFAPETSADLEKIYASSADLLLLDSKGGGSGKTFDWSIAKQISRPFLLAGGLNPENIQQALSQVRPFGVDVSSGVETDGKKDFEKMQLLLKNIRAWEEICNEYTGKQ